MDSLITINRGLMDGSQRAVYMLPIIQEALNATLYWTITVLATVVVTLATQLRASPGFTGASLVALMQFGMMLAAIIRSWTQLETAIGAVSRLQSFSKTIKSEYLENETDEPSENWPQHGSVDIWNVSAAYRYTNKSCLYCYRPADPS
jgi:ATP-binding cassette subfamily C (CFTR/MRP) protein 1